MIITERAVRSFRPIAYPHSARRRSRADRVDNSSTATRVPPVCPRFLLQHCSGALLTNYSFKEATIRMYSDWLCLHKLLAGPTRPAGLDDPGAAFAKADGGEA